MKQTPDVQIIPIENNLIKKTGAAGFSGKFIESVQQKVDSIKLDIEPFLQKMLDDIKSQLKNIFSGDTVDDEGALDQLLAKLGALNTHLKLLKRPPLIDISDGILHFSERLNHFNSDNIQIIKAHVTVLEILLKSPDKNDDQKEVAIMQQELQASITRYYNKYK